MSCVEFTDGTTVQIKCPSKYWLIDKIGFSKDNKR